MLAMVAYGLAEGEWRENEQRREARAWAGNRRGEPLWRRDGRSAPGLPAETRHRLQQALFLVRANIASTMWLPSWEVLGTLADRELVCAEVWASRGRVVVAGEVVDADGPVPGEQRLLRDLASTGARLWRSVDPRDERGDPAMGSDPDIGAWDSDWERARFAFKLREDFGLTLEQTADVLNADDYETTTGKPFSGGLVKHLLDSHAGELRARSSTAVGASAQTASLHGREFLVTFGPDAQELTAAAAAYNDGLDRPHELVHALVEAADVAGDDPAERHQLRQLLTGARAGFFTTVWVSSTASFGSPLARELALAELWRNGVVVMAGGEVLDSDSRADSVTAALRPVARSSARLYAMLRAHDQDAIVGDATTLEAARVVARALGDRGRSLAEIATHLNREAFPTRKRVGSWGAPAVRELLREPAQAAGT